MARMMFVSSRRKTAWASTWSSGTTMKRSARPSNKFSSEHVEALRKTAQFVGTRPIKCLLDRRLDRAALVLAGCKEDGSGGGWAGSERLGALAHSVSVFSRSAESRRS